MLNQLNPIDLLFTQTKVQRKLRLAINNMLNKHKLNLSEWIILTKLQSEEKLSFAGLSDLMEVESPRITKLISKLQDNTLVKVRVYSKDRRVKYVTITAKGQRLLEKVQNQVVSAIQDYFSPVEKTNLATYLNVLMQLAETKTSPND